MTVTNSYTRQPTKLDYASPTQFKFQIIKLPKVEIFQAQMYLVLTNTAEQITPLKDIPQLMIDSI